MIRAPKPGRVAPTPPPRFKPLSTFLGILVFAGTFVFTVVVAAQNELFGLGMFTVCPTSATFLGLVVASRGRRVTPLAGAGFAALSTVLTSALLLGLGLEAMACVLMAIALVLPMTLMSGFVYGLFSTAIQTPPFNPPANGDRAGESSGMSAWILIAVFSLPGATTWVESKSEGSARSVSTEIVIDATPHEVWKNVVSFPQLDANGAGSDHWTFALGYPQPVRCDLEGEGVGAYRFCIFEDSRTEDPVFDERITVWAPGEELTFACDDQPSRIDPYLQVTEGQFRFVALPDGRTKIIGTTWYTLRCAPYGYFDWWCEEILHGIHTRVLEHVKKLSELKRDA